MNAGTMKIQVNSFWGAFLFLLGKVTLDPTGRILIISVRVSRPQYRVADIFARSTSCSYLKGNFDFFVTQELSKFVISSSFWLCSKSQVTSHTQWGQAKCVRNSIKFLLFKCIPVNSSPDGDECIKLLSFTWSQESQTQSCFYDMSVRTTLVRLGQCIHTDR